jgi:hypothetical protein|nr:MAG TPA: Protein of unknown function (DUF1642) [Caudoviricetes sp.]
MNKQELIAEYEQISNFVDTVKTKSVIDKLKQLDEPKVQVPEFVADWIFKAQFVDRRSIRSALDTCTIRLYAKRSDEVIAWLKEINNQDIFVSGWANDYEVEKKKEYTVKVKATLGQYLGRYYLSNEELTPQFTRTQFTGNEKLPTFTRAELEQTGFGWVFDCPGIEIEEVEG